MTRASIPSLVLAAAVCLPTAAAPADVTELGWLAGCWEGEGGGGRNEECWTTPNGGLLLGVNRVHRERGTSFEFLRIGPHEDGLALYASPGGKPAVPFQLVDGGENFAVFANPEHDFPQRITYRREGDGMTARVEAERDGSWDGFDISWKLAGGVWPAASATDADDAGDAGDPAEPAEPEQQVRATETAFSRSMDKRDPEAFASFLAEEAIFLSAATARGAEAINEQWAAYFSAPEAPFSWRPETVEVLASGGLALSTGPVHDAQGRLISRFTSIWRREPTGAWRIVFDKGERVCPPTG